MAGSAKLGGIDPLFDARDPPRILVASDTFEPCARSNWHTHPLGQTLLITSGCGYVQSWGGPIKVIRPGDMVWCPPGETHGHGASRHTAMTHIAIQEGLDDKGVDWTEKVTDDQYNAPPQEYRNIGIKENEMKTAALLALMCLLAPIGVALAVDQSAGLQTVSVAGSQPSAKGPAEYFTGNARVDPLFAPKDTAPFSGAYVTFEPGSRSNWHTHPTGQHLIVTSGVGWTQAWHGPIVEIRAGDVVWCPPGVKHWHGATPTTAMTHLALTGTVGGKNVEWLEKVTDEQYHSK